MFDVSHITVPYISDLFTKAKEKHMHKTRLSYAYITTSRLSQTQGYFARFGQQPVKCSNLVDFHVCKCARFTLCSIIKNSNLVSLAIISTGKILA